MKVLPYDGIPSEFEIIARELSLNKSGTGILIDKLQRQLREKIKPDHNLLSRGKMLTYKAWGFIWLYQDMIGLTDDGRKFASANADEKIYLYRKAISRIEHYTDLISDLICINNYDITFEDIRNRWLNKNLTIHNRVQTFIKLCEAAQIGEIHPGFRYKNTHFIFYKSEIAELLPVSSLIPLKDEKQAVFTLPPNVSQKDAQYIYDALKIILKKNYDICIE